MITLDDDDINNNPDNDIISERLKRFIETFPVSSDDGEENDDEFHFTSTGQTVKRKGFSHGYHITNDNPIETISTRKVSNKNWSSSICVRYSNHSSVSSLFCESEWYFFIMTSACLLIGALVHRYRLRHLSSSVQRSPSNTTTVETRRSMVVTTTKNVEPATTEEECTTDTPTTDKDNGKTSSVPNLVPDENDKHSKIESNSKALEVHPTVKNNTINAVFVPRSIQTTSEDANHLVSLVSDLKQKCEIHGIEYDPNIAWKWAMQQQTTDKIINAQLFTSYCDRTLSQQQHNANRTASREDKEWLTKLYSVQSKFHMALVTATYQCIAGTFLVVATEPLIFLVHLYYTLSGPELLCYGTGTSMDPTIMIPKQSQFSYYWYDRYTPTFSYIDTYTTATLGEAVTCAAYTGGRFLFFVGFVVLLYIASWILHQLAISQGIQQFLKSGLLLWVLSAFGWLRKYHLYQMALCLGVTVITCYFYITYQHKSTCNEFRSMKPILPQVSDVNEKLLWFDEAIEIIRMLPMLFVTFILVLLYVRQD